MKRGEIWTAAGGAAYARKPRPVLIVQDDVYSRTDSVAVCPITSEQITTEFFRPALQPTSANGLKLPSRIMVDKIAALPRHKLGDQIGTVELGELREVETALMTFLGIAR